MVIRRKRDPRTAQAPLPFEYQVVPDAQAAAFTAHGGLPLVLDTMRITGVSAAIEQELHFRKRQSGYSERELLEAMVLLIAVGGECMEEIAALGEDRALLELLGVEKLPSPDALRAALLSFHDESKLEQARAALGDGEKALLVRASEPLKQLGRVNTALIAAMNRAHPAPIATLEADASIIESHKRQAMPHYEGGRGYQPVVVYWVEHDAILHTEFRDGNVPAGKEPLRALEDAVAALPSGVRRRFRGDSAFYESHMLRFLTDPTNAFERFTISADMGTDLRKLCVAAPSDAWRLLEERANESVWITEVVFTPGELPKNAQPLRTIAIRFDPRQSELFDGDGNARSTKYLAIVSNDWDEDAGKLLRWHWQKAGSIERVHDVLKNELAAGVLPCAEFGANAAWFLINALTYNILSALKTSGLPPALHDARPKRLRLRVLNLGAQLVSHARSLFARVAETLAAGVELLSVRPRLRLDYSAPSG